MSEELVLLEKAYKASVDSGDQPFACYSAVHIL